MTISCGLCWNIDSRKIIWPLRAHFGSENESLKGLSYSESDISVAHVLGYNIVRFGSVLHSLLTVKNKGNFFFYYKKTIDAEVLK